MQFFDETQELSIMNAREELTRKLNETKNGFIMNRNAWPRLERPW